MKEGEERVNQSKNIDDACKFKKHNVSHSMPSNVCQESHCSESDDESVYSTSDFFKPIFRDHNKNKSIESEKNFEETAMKEKIFSSVNQYKISKASFCKIYHRWLPERQNTLKELRLLLNEVHDKTRNYYKSQASLKELSYNSRRYKETENQTIDFFASLAAFVSDAASGITSFAQALEMDSYQSRFQEIMDHDSEITKDLYASRSQCVSEYEGIEEVIRKFHPNTLTSTVNKISDTLLVDKYWTAMKNAYDENNMPKLLDEVGKFFDNACQSEVLQSVSASVNKFITDNPAALEACKSTGKAVYGAIDAFSEKKDKNAAIEYVNKTTNLYLMLEDKKDIDRLNRIIDEDIHQSELESQIEAAIDSLEDEMKEIKETYFEMFSTYDSD